MKPWLQVLFAQGYLWRDRFPDELEKAKVGTRKVRLPSLIPLGMMVMVSLALLGGAKWLTGAPVVALSLGWFLFRSYPLRLDALLGSPQFWISAAWVGGVIALISTLVLLIASLATGTWELVPLSVLAWLGIVTPWLRGVQANYLILARPADNSWRLDPSLNPQPSGFPAAWRLLLAETYWRLPRQILFDVEAAGPPAQGGIA